MIIIMKCWRTAFSFHWKLSVEISIIYVKETEYYWLICDRLVTGCFGAAGYVTDITTRVEFPAEIQPDWNNEQNVAICSIYILVKPN